MNIIHYSIRSFFSNEKYSIIWFASKRLFVATLLQGHSCKARRGVSSSYSRVENRVSEDRISNYASFVEKLSHPCLAHSHFKRSHRGPAPLDRVKLAEMVNSDNYLLQLRATSSVLGEAFQRARVVRTLQRTSSPSSSAASNSRSMMVTEKKDSAAGIETAELRSLVAGIQRKLIEHLPQVASNIAYIREFL